MPKLKLISVQCTTPDEIDKDEIYLKHEGNKIWPGDGLYHRVDTADVESIEVMLDVPDGWVEIELWDFDYLSLNDLLGSFKMKVDDTPGEYSTSMQLHEKRSTASYILRWEILE
ncbi:MAG: hypothetical protein KI790_15755 [Cyclobacteriaceae bacterium]|nr:hypothetical protein [Cyclobacteriaceae bacterium HetDA_MAG_MS6]